MSRELPLDYTKVGPDRVLVFLVRSTTIVSTWPEFMHGIISVNVWPPAGFAAPALPAEKIAIDLCNCIGRHISRACDDLRARGLLQKAGAPFTIFIKQEIPDLRATIVFHQPSWLPHTSAEWMDLLEGGIRAYLKERRPEYLFLSYQL